MTSRTLATMLLILAATPAVAQTQSPPKPQAPTTTSAGAAAEPTTGDSRTPVPNTATATPVAPAESAAPPKRIAGVDLMSATVMQEKQSSFSGLAVRLRLTIPNTIPGVEVLPTLEYWRNSSTLTPYDIKGTRVDATLGSDIRYAFQAGAWNPYVGAGYAVHFLSTEVNAQGLGLTDRSDSVIKGGLAALLGITFPLTPRVDNFLELKYHHIPEYKQLKINWGVSIGL